MWRIELNTRHPSLNEWLSSNGGWFKKANDKKKYQEELLWELKAQKIPSKLKTPISINCTQFTKRKRDIDNTIISAKYLADALVAGGYIEDDAPEYVKIITISWAKASKEEKVVYMIDEI